MEFVKDTKLKGTTKFRPDIKKAKNDVVSARYSLIGMKTRTVLAVTTS